jgi:hypothetical protein
MAMLCLLPSVCRGNSRIKWSRQQRPAFLLKGVAWYRRVNTRSVVATFMGVRHLVDPL